MRKALFWLQTASLIGTTWVCYYVSGLITQMLLLRALVGTIMWIPIAWSVLSVLSLLDKDNRIAAKLGIKIENYHVYEAFYKRWRESLLKGNDDEYAALMEEMQRLPDQSGFQRYFMYKCKEIVGKYPIQDETKDPSIPSV